MDMTQSEILYVLLCCFAVYTFATFVQRVCGFGMGIVAILLLPLLIQSYSLPAAITNACSAFSASPSSDGSARPHVLSCESRWQMPSAPLAWRSNTGRTR